MSTHDYITRAGVAALVMRVIIASCTLATSLSTQAQITSISSWPSGLSDEEQAKLNHDVFSGHLAAKQKNYALAATHWEAALKNPALAHIERPKLYLKLSQVYAALGEYDKAKTSLECARDVEIKFEKQMSRIIVCRIPSPPRLPGVQP